MSAERRALLAVRPETIRKVVKYLEEELNLRVYGNYTDVESAETYPGCMDYDGDAVVALRRFYLAGHAFTELD